MESGVAECRNEPSSCSCVVVVVVVEEVVVVVDEVMWIFRPITCDKNMTHTKFTSVLSARGKGRKPHKLSDDKMFV